MRNTGQRRRTREELAALAKAFEDSGETRRDYAAAHGIAVHTLDYYRRRSAARPAPPPLIELDWQSGIVLSGSRAEMTIRLRNGRLLEASSAALAQMALNGDLARLLAAADPD